MVFPVLHSDRTRRVFLNHFGYRNSECNYLSFICFSFTILCSQITQKTHNCIHMCTLSRLDPCYLGVIGRGKARGGYFLSFCKNKSKYKFSQKIIGIYIHIYIYNTYRSSMFSYVCESRWNLLLHSWTLFIDIQIIIQIYNLDHDIINNLSKDKMTPRISRRFPVLRRSCDTRGDHNEPPPPPESSPPAIPAA